MAHLVLNFKQLWHRVSGNSGGQISLKKWAGSLLHFFVYSSVRALMSLNGWQRQPFSPVLRGFILDALSVFSVWVRAQGCVHGTLNSRGCPCSTLFRSELIYVCQATAELGTWWWAGEACWSLCIWQVLLLLGGAYARVREQQRGKTLGGGGWEWVLREERKGDIKNRGDWYPHSKWKQPGRAWLWCLSQCLASLSGS